MPNVIKLRDSKIPILHIPPPNPPEGGLKMWKVDFYFIKKLKVPLRGVGGLLGEFNLITPIDSNLVITPQLPFPSYT